jgi:hypothetical protein
MTELIILIQAALALLFFVKWRSAEYDYELLLESMNRELDKAEKKKPETPRHKS